VLGLQYNTSAEEALKGTLMSSSTLMPFEGVLRHVMIELMRMLVYYALIDMSKVDCEEYS
jgi:hypothetical protein